MERGDADWLSVVGGGYHSYTVLRWLLYPAGYTLADDERLALPVTRSVEGCPALLYSILYK